MTTRKRKNHAPEFKTKVAHETIREKITLAELAKKYGVHANQISTWKRTALDAIVTVFTKRGEMPKMVDEEQIDKLHSKIGQLVVELITG